MANIKILKIEMTLMDLIKMDWINMVIKKKDTKSEIEILKAKLKILKVKLKILKVKLKLAKQNLLKIKKEKDTLIYLFFYLKHILIIIQKN